MTDEGNEIARRRKALGKDMSQAKLAEECRDPKIAQNTIYRIENGAHSRYTQTILKTLDRLEWERRLSTVAAVPSTRAAVPSSNEPMIPARDVQLAFELLLRLRLSDLAAKEAAAVLVEALLNPQSPPIRVDRDDLIKSGILSAFRKFAPPNDE